jgi:hypothetical protein
VGNGVNVRAGADGRERGIGARPAGKGVADGVDSDGEAGFLTEAADVGAGAQVGLAEDEAGNYGRV